MKKLRIVFMGTPEFAVASLEAILDTDHLVVAVITAPDKPKGRGQKLIPSPVKEVALKHHIPVLQPTNLKSPVFISELQQFEPDLQVVVAFRMLPEVVWELPTIGTFNLHASLLPQYRGAAPIQWAVINGEEKTGVTTFFIDKKIDTGQLLLQAEEPIYPDDTGGSLYNRLMKKGANLVVKTLEDLAANRLDPSPQPEPVELNLAPKLFRENCKINWSKPVSTILNFVRGLNPYPAAWTNLKGTEMKIFKVERASSNGSLAPAGTIDTDNKTYLKVAAGDGWVSVLELQTPGKKVMEVQAFLRGNTI